MKVVVQRCHHARVVVDGEVVGEVQHGALLLLGVLLGDDPACATRLAERVARFRFFDDGKGRMGRSAAGSAGTGTPEAFLIVSQFTLAADGRKGRRPSFDRAAPPEIAEPLYEQFCEDVRRMGIEVATGRFRATMTVDVSGDGPVTFVLEEAPRNAPSA